MKTNINKNIPFFATNLPRGTQGFAKTGYLYKSNTKSITNQCFFNNCLVNRVAQGVEDEIQTETVQYSIDRENDELIIDGTTYILAEESENQIKYYMIVPNGTNLAHNVIFLLQ